MTEATKMDDVMGRKAAHTVFEWLDFYPLVTEIYGRRWHTGGGRGEWGQNTYVSLEVEGDPAGTDFEDAADIRAAFDHWLSLPVPFQDAPYHERHPMEDALEQAEPSVDMIMWDLCRRGIVKPGKYLMLVWW